MAAMFSRKIPFWACLLLVMTALTIVGCSKSKSSYDYLTQAREAHEQGNNQSALINLKNALKKDPKNGEARLLFAQILNERGEGQAAEIEVRKAIDLGVNESYAAAALGKALLIQNQYKKVLNEVKVAGGGKGKVAADIYNVRGDAYLGLRKVDDAKSAFDSALKEYPDSTDAYIGKARLAALQNNLDDALHQIEIGLSKDQNNTAGWLLKARFLKLQAKYGEARAAYKHILHIDKSNIVAHLGLASLDMSQKKLDAAKTEVDAAIKIAPNSLDARYGLALVDFQLENFKEAQDAIEEVLKSTPDYLPGVLLQGVIAYYQGSYEQALSNTNRFLARYPSNAYARRLLAVTQLKLGETDKAMETLQPLLKPELADSKALALAGEAQLMAKKYDKAAEYLQKAMQINSPEPQLQAQLALSRIGAGNIEQGINELEEVAKQSPGQSPADMILIVSYLQRKEYDQALDTITNLEKKLSPNPVTYTLRGTALIGKQDFVGSRKAFEQALTIQPDYFPAVAKLAQLDLRDNKPDAAHKRLEDFLEKNKNNGQAMMALAELAARRKQGQEYVRWLEKAIKTHPNVILYRAKLADYYVAKKDHTKALALANETVSAYPNSPDALNLLGAIQRAVGDNEGAVLTYGKLVKMAPDLAAAYLQLAMAQTAAKNLKEARVSLNKALELQSNYPQARAALIRLDLAENKGDDALKIARQIQAQQPKAPVGYDAEGDILFAQKNYAQAVTAYDKALTRSAGSIEMIKLLRALTIAGDGKAVEQRMKSWIKQHPNDVVVRGYAGYWYTVNNRNLDAIAQYEKVLKIAPQSPLALNNLANLYQRQGDNRALATAEQAYKLAPDFPGIQDTLGWMLVGQGQLPRSIDLLSKAAIKEPKEGAIHYHLGVALARSGRKAEAKKELEAAIRTGQDFPGLADAKTMLKGL